MSRYDADPEADLKNHRSTRPELIGAVVQTLLLAAFFAAMGGRW